MILEILKDKRKIKEYLKDIENDLSEVITIAENKVEAVSEELPA